MFCINPLTRKKRSPLVPLQRQTLRVEGRNLVKREAVETEEEISLRSYGSVLRYQCGLARRFYEPDLDEEYDERNMTCNWNKTWTNRGDIARLCPVIDPFCAWKLLLCHKEGKKCP